MLIGCKGYEETELCYLVAEVVEEEIQTFGMDIGLEADTDGLEEVFSQHADELSTDKMLDLVQEQTERLMEVTEEEREEGEVLTTTHMKEILRQWDVRRLVEAHHPNKINSGDMANFFEEQCIRHFKDDLKMHQKKIVSKVPL